MIPAFDALQATITGSVEVSKDKELGLLTAVANESLFVNSVKKMADFGVDVNKSR